YEFSRTGFSGASYQCRAHLDYSCQAEARDTHFCYPTLCLESTRAAVEHLRNAPGYCACPFHAAGDTLFSAQFANFGLGFNAPGYAHKYVLLATTTALFPFVGKTGSWVGHWTARAVVVSAGK